MLWRALKACTPRRMRSIATSSGNSRRSRQATVTWARWFQCSRGIEDWSKAARVIGMSVGLGLGIHAAVRLGGGRGFGEGGVPGPRAGAGTPRLAGSHGLVHCAASNKETTHDMAHLPLAPDPG